MFPSGLPFEFCEGTLVSGTVLFIEVALRHTGKLIHAGVARVCEDPTTHNQFIVFKPCASDEFLETRELRSHNQYVVRGCVKPAVDVFAMPAFQDETPIEWVAVEGTPSS